MWEDHIGHWNWNKLIGLGGLLQKRLINAVNEFYKQRGYWVKFTEKQQCYALRWRRMVDDYENRRSTRNPYISPIDGKTAQSVRLEPAQEAEKDARKKLEEVGLTADSDEESDNDDVLPELVTSPEEFLFFGLEIEQQQCELHYNIEAIQAPTNKQLTYMLSSSQRPSDLSGIEIRLREGQLNESLNQLRRVILVKQRLLYYKKINAWNQGTTTRTRGIIKQQDKKIELAAAAYRAAWDAQPLLLNGISCSMSILIMAKAAKGNGAEAERRTLAGEDPVPGAREKNRVALWIWYGTSQGDLETDKALYDGLQTEWCKAYAQVKRWKEEVLLLQEEMRRCLITLEWQACQWVERARIDTFKGERLEGASAYYAHEQAAIQHSIASRFQKPWNSTDLREFQPSDLALRNVVPGLDEIDVLPEEDKMDTNPGMDEDEEELLPSVEDEVERDTNELTSLHNKDLVLEHEEKNNEEEEEDNIEDEKQEQRLEGEDKQEVGEMDIDNEGDEESPLTLKEMLITLEEDQGY
ncbi:hypothetical protein K435DRAFT_802334 [Dendrothele bispora CBS 962.96]|uniref:Uncharacterized protein n=1 Tax=Dendrothele bispora (strain CBS 962.96) TaxID=1314807 RepID=A0A4S8LL59_DENBC|nr:hypothetical protein K435DRAFT_802334 [Dendrothele bispora CBS 962.96]